MRKLAPTLLVITLICSLQSADALAASNGGDARALLEQARARFGKGEIGRTRELLKRAAAGTKDGMLLGQIHLLVGLTWASENRARRAKDSFVQALRHDPSLGLDATRYKPAFVALFERVQRTTVGKLEVETNGPTSTVRLDGREVGKTPYSGFLLAGSHDLLLVSPSGAQRRSSITIEAGKITRLLLGAGPTTGATVASRPTAVDSPQHHPKRRARLWTWVAAGAAVASAGLAIGLGVAAKADQSEACGLLAGSGACDGRGALVDPADRGRYETLSSSMNDKALATTIAWSGAGVLALTAAVLFFFEGRGSGEHSGKLSVSPREISLRFTF